MKKNRLALIAVTLLVATAGHAQSLSLKGEMIHKNDMGNMPNQKFEISKDRRRTGPKRTVDNGVYYTIPGALFGGFNVEGSGYIYSMAMVPPFVNVTYANQMSNKSNSSWKVNDYDVPEASKVNGDFVYYYSPNSMSYTPVLGNKNNNTYQFNEDNYWTQTGNYSTNDISYVMTFSPDLMMTPCDIHGTKWYNGTAYRNTANGYGALSTGFLYGTGSYDGVASYGFEQTYNPLLAPLCVDEIHLNAITYNRTGPIPSGKSIKAYILALDEEGNVKETLATFEATSKDTMDFKSSTTYNNKTAYLGALVYKNTAKSGNTSLPAAIPANTPFRIQFEGMDNSGVSIGAYGIYKSEVEDTYIENGFVLMKDGSSFDYDNPLCIYIDLLAQYEVIDVPTKHFLSYEQESDFPKADFEGWNVLRVSKDGKTIHTEGLAGTNYDMGCAFVGTSAPWTDDDGLKHYDVDRSNLPDWVEDVQVDNSYYESSGLNGYNLVAPVCKPLPAGVTKRSCEIDIAGHAGIKGNNKIVIIQGDENSGVEPTNTGLYSETVELKTGDTGSISLNLDNDKPIIMVEFFLQLPDGVSITTDEDGYLNVSLNDERSDRHSIEVERSSNGLYHFLVFHTRNKVILGNSGELIHINVICDKNMEAGTYSGVVRNILLNDEDKNEINLPDYSFNINVTDVTMGDVNGDNKINGSDIVEMVDHIMGRPSSKFVEAAADLSGDGKINGSDLTLEIELVMSQGMSSAPKQHTRDGLSIGNNHDGTMSVSVDGDKGYILAQMVVELSPGQKLEGFHTDNSHKVVCRQLPDNRYFVLCYSSGNAPFSSNDDILTIRYSGEGDTSISNAMLVDETRTECHFSPVCSGDATGIVATRKDITQAVDVYSLDGALVKKQATSLEGLPKGVYLVNGNKLFIK